MPRRLLLAAVLAAIPAGAPIAHADDTRYITIGADALPTAAALALPDGGSLELLAAGGEVAVLAVPEAALDALSHDMHERHGRCGGYMVHDSRAEAEAALAPPPAPRDVTYTLDRGDVVRAVLPQVNARNIVDTIATLSAMKNRYYLSESGAAASAWLHDRWASFTRRRDVTFERVDHGYPQRSVIMTIRGTTRPDEVVVIGGHLDSIALGGKSATAPGADDDASGIATLTEVARALLAADFRPERTIKFMAYAAEEVGLRGSLRIAKDFRARGVDVVGVLQLDMTNYQGSDRDIWLIDDHTSKDQNRFLVQLIEAYTDATWGVDVCGYACSDHASWTRHGYRASMPFEARFAQSNRTIHTRKDTLETSGHNAAHAVKFARLATAYAIELGKGQLGERAPGERAGAAAVEPRACATGPALRYALLGALALAGLLLARAFTRTVSVR